MKDPYDGANDGAGLEGAEGQKSRDTNNQVGGDVVVGPGGLASEHGAGR